jgi:hypothetical protein
MWILITVMLVFHVVGFLSSITAVMGTRTAQGAIAWAIALNTFPYVAVPAYWILGRSRFQGYISARQDGDNEIRYVVLAALICASAAASAAMAMPFPDAPEIRGLLTRAEMQLRLGVVEKGAGRSFDEAFRLIHEAEEQLDRMDLSSENREKLTREIEAVRDDWELTTELYERRFYGVFPLARLTVPTLFADDGFVVTEQLFHPPDEAAVESAARAFLFQIDDYHRPHVVVGSSQSDRGFENLVLEILLRNGRTTVHTRRELVEALSPRDLEAFNMGKSTPQIVDRVRTAVDAVNLMVLTVGQPVELDDASVRSLHGDFYVPGEVVQGSPLEASLVIRAQSLQYLGFARDRRAQLWPIVATQLLLFALAVAWAARIQWSIDRPLKTFLKLAIGATLFVFGRMFIIGIVILLMQVDPDPNTLVAAAWWWPALLGLLAVLGGGLAAWIGQARLTDIVPGARGARAVGSIFALTAIGASSYFVAPLLLLDEGRGFSSLVPYVLASMALAVLFGFAVRTGPPVPHYFAVGPLILASILGVCLLMASPVLLWSTTAMTGALCLAAWFRHRYAAARGTEEPEPSPEAAAEADQQRLVKLREKLSKK